VTSVMLVLAKPMPAVTAKTKVNTHTAQPAREMARWRNPPPARQATTHRDVRSCHGWVRAGAEADGFPSACF
jgi:hypothetical protein